MPQFGVFFAISAYFSVLCVEYAPQNTVYAETTEDAEIGEFKLRHYPLSGSGTATHLGQWTVAGNPKYTLDDQGVFHSSGEATLTIANGDKLFIQINGILDPVAGVDQGVFYFVGGTGRFQGASGTAQFVVNINPVTQGFDLTVVGKIDY